MSPPEKGPGRKVLPFPDPARRTAGEWEDEAPTNPGLADPASRPSPSLPRPSAPAAPPPPGVAPAAGAAGAPAPPPAAPASRAPGPAGPLGSTAAPPPAVAPAAVPSPPPTPAAVAPPPPAPAPAHAPAPAPAPAPSPGAAPSPPAARAPEPAAPSPSRADPAATERPRRRLPRGLLPAAALLGAMLLLVAPFTTWVPDGDMAPALLPGDLVLILPVEPHVGDVVALLDPLDPGRWTLRRVAALEGEVRYDEGSLHVDGDDLRLVDMGRDDDHVYLEEGGFLVQRSPRPVRWAMDVREVPPGHAWLVAADQDLALDSRWWGPAPLEAVQGVVVARVGVPGNRWRGWFEGRPAAPER